MKKFIWHIYRKINKLPRMVCIEACSLCQLNCPDCHMRKNDPDLIVGNGYLKFKDFKRFVDKHPYIESIELSFCGEIFLNPELLEIIEYAHKKNIELTAFNGVNFNTVSDEMLEALVKYKFTGITFSIDGTTQETYQKYRRNGNINKVFENIKKLNSYKKQYNSIFPLLTWQYITFEHTIHEIKNTDKLKDELGIHLIFFKYPWSEECHSKEALIEISKLKKETKTNIKYDFKEKSIHPCLFLWLRPQINWNGKLLGCFCSTHHDMNINVFNTSLKKALKCKKIEHTKNILMGKIPVDTTVECHRCVFYKNLKNKNRFINESYIKFI